MNILFNAVRFKAEQKLEDFISEKLEKLDKVHDSIVGAEVNLKIDNTDSPENKIVEIRVKIKGYDALASKTAKSFEEATDLAVDALKKQLLKSKEKERGN